MNDNLAIKCGLIACFDILGYKEVLKHNDVRTVLNLLDTSIGEAIKEAENFGENCKDGSRERTTAQRLSNDFDYLVFSDTAIIACPFASNPSRVDAENLTFLVHFSSCFLAKMFVRGLPLRGAIHLGEYFVGNVPNIRDRVCAGAGIIAAYEDANRHDWSGCVFSSEAAEEVQILIERSDGYADHLKKILLRYPAPLKQGEQSRLVINYLFPFFPLPENKVCMPISEIRAEVLKQFSDNGKMIDEKCKSKLLNTEIFLTFCRAKHEEHLPAK